MLVGLQPIDYVSLAKSREVQQGLPGIVSCPEYQDKSTGGRIF